MDWKPLAISVPMLFVIYQSLSKLLPKDVSVFLVNTYASLAGLILMLTLYLLTRGPKTVPLQAKYIWLAIGIGLLIGLGNAGIIKAYELGAPQSSFTAIYYSSLIIYGTLFGWTVWHERLKLVQVAGILMVIFGIFIATYFRK